jgi:hypothetical protein
VSAERSRRAIAMIESPCCEAPSTSLIRVARRLTPNDDRRCIRCRQPFCRIDVDGRKSPFRVAVGARAK